MINVLGDGYVAGAVAHLLQNKLSVSDDQNQFRAEVREGIGNFAFARTGSSIYTLQGTAF